MAIISTAIITGTIVGVTVGTKLGVLAGVIAATAVLGIGLIQRFLLTPGQTGLDAQGTQQTLRTESAPAEWPFGEVRKAGILAYVLNSGGKKTKQHILMRILVGHGPCDAVTAIHIGDDKLKYTTTNVPVETGHHNERFLPAPARTGALLPDSQGKLHRPTRANVKEYAAPNPKGEDRFNCISMFSADGTLSQTPVSYTHLTLPTIPLV